MMRRHRRGRSLSEALTLEQSEEGGLVVSGINSASVKQGLREGDELLGATINFNTLSKDEVLQVLKLIEPYNDKVQVLTRNNLSKSLGNLDQVAKSPDTMLKDSYSKLYKAKIKRFMKGDSDGPEDSGVNANSTLPGSSKVSLKQDSGLPRLGVDFGRLKTKNPSTNFNVDSEFDDATLSGDLTDGSNMNLPPMGLGWAGAAVSGGQVPRLKVDGRSPQINTPDFHLSRTLPEGIKLPTIDSPSADLTMPNLERPRVGLESNGAFSAPEIGDLPNLGFSGPSFSGPEYDIRTPGVETPDLSSGRDHVLRARASTLDPQASYNYGDMVYPSGANIDMRDPRHSRRIPAGDVDVSSKHQRTMQPVPDNSDGYYVTVFPTQAQNRKMSNRKSNTLGGLDFHPGNMDLEVPDSELKGSTHFFYNLV
uniref:neuroblast differentiation-associated protein AHNAK-like isoform X1 n=1 Tax=Monopterus albus TaxID=43700 RepID=UPI0009B3739F|nr:neuroblast differentiation-associated protein AHNAK-like isoform X1 [Monopterus albus]XP_020442225.1 neuroblast differentiation-associated protein AHNAK-like isoform X1 [Monopterus albus]